MRDDRVVANQKKFRVQTEDSANIRLVDLSGRTLLRQEVLSTNIELDMTVYPSAVYMIQVQAGDVLVTKKIAVR